jgi:hypothetical protein
MNKSSGKLCLPLQKKNIENIILVVYEIMILNVTINNNSTDKDVNNLLHSYKFFSVEKSLVHFAIILLKLHIAFSTTKAVIICYQ